MARRKSLELARGSRLVAGAAVLVSATALGACTSAEGGDTGGGSGGSAQGGSPPTGGTGAIGGLGGATGGAAPSGGAAGATSGSAGIGTGGSAGAATGGAPSGGSAGAGGAGAAGAPAGAGMGGAGGAAAGSGGAPGGSGPGGAGSGGAAGDRCDVAVHDPSDPPAIVSVSGSTGTHDPVVMEASGRFYLFHTGGGMGLGAKTSTDFMQWANASTVFPTNPSWISPLVSGVMNLWAPDISFFGGQYHLYYSASTFGSNQSCIGHATRPALDTGSWTDQGRLICSNVGTNDNWNAIDPNVVVDEAGMPWLSFGSFWSGLKIIPLDMTGARMGTAAPIAIANRPSNGGALEAPFIVRRCGYYYLFMSWDRCCQGADSTYNIRVARSTSVTGPYTDKAGTAANQGGGTLLVQGDARWKGPGHNAVIFRGNAAYNVYHSYDANANGRVTLRISELVWDAEGWPISAGP
ncbi:MAG TPA: arabinan endo-1,5-alpha-L-arabinosidase [Polyangiaceae bacterium]